MDGVHQGSESELEVGNEGSVMFVPPDSISKDPPKHVTEKVSEVLALTLMARVGPSLRSATEKFLRALFADDQFVKDVAFSTDCNVVTVTWNDNSTTEWKRA